MDPNDYATRFKMHDLKGNNHGFVTYAFVEVYNAEGGQAYVEEYLYFLIKKSRKLMNRYGIVGQVSSFMDCYVVVHFHNKADAAKYRILMGL